jgi:hypothetical protein
MHPTILIVEDEAVVAANLASKLERAGYDVVATASTGAEAIALTRRLHPQLVLMDIQIEGELDGIQTAETIQHHCDVPVIYLTAYSDAATLSRAKLTGPSGYILKPFETREVTTQIDLALYKHRTNREIKEQRQWLHVILTSIGDAVIATNSQGDIEFINPTARRLTEWTAKAPIGHPIDEVFSILEAQTSAPLAALITGDSGENHIAALSGDCTLKTRTGRQIPIEANATRIQAESGQSLGMALVFRDITERKKYRDTLERTNRDLKQFAYAASHDLQEPLRAFHGFLKLLQSHFGERIDEKARDYLEHCMAAGHRMQTLLDDLLILAKASTQPVDFAPTNINAIVTKALGTLGAGTDQKNARISCADLPQLPVDANQMQSLFQNLLSNALKYNRSDSPQITIDCQEAGAAYHFRVRDNGIGIAPEFQQRIFQLFQRLHTEREYPGTGMGLSLCQKIVERHGGRIWVESEPGNGSTFHFSLPK